MSKLLDSDGPILIVEDDLPTAELELKVLLRVGKAARIVQCADDAVAALNQGPFTAVLLDYLLAGEQGWSVLEAAQAMHPPVPVIVVTGHGNEEVAVEALRRGAADYVIKNGDYWEHLPSIIERIVQTAQAQSLRNALAAAVESSDDAIVGISEDGRVANWNGGAARIFGESTVAVLGRPVLEFFPGDRHFAVTRAFEKLKNGGRVDAFETVGTSKSGALIDLSVALSPILNDRKQFIGISLSARDISERKRAEERLKRTEFQLRQLQRLEAVREIAGGVAHEFNNLLTVIIVRCELMLQNRVHEPSTMSDIGLIIKTSERAASVARQLLAFSGQQFLRPRAVDINAVVNDIQASLKQVVGSDIELETKLASEHLQVKADPVRIDDIIVNLAMNARDAMPHGGKLTFETSNAMIDEAFVRSHDGAKSGLYVLLTVSDTGCGMDANTLPRVFDPFFTTKGRAKRSGLGLAMVYGTIKQSGGFILVESEVGKGSRFKIYLPCMEPSNSSANLPAVGNVKTCEGKTILIVEDTLEVLEIVKETLDTCGYSLLTASHPREAIQIVERYAGTIDLLLTDVVMPEMNGTELAIRLEALQPTMKVIYMSGYPESHLGVHGDAEINFISKPLSLGGLKRKVSEVLTKKQA